MKQTLFLLLSSAALLSQPSVFASEDLTSETYEFSLSPVDETTESLSFEKQFYPIGQMLVNKRTQEGLTLVCRRFDDHGKCSRFQFALHPVAGELSSYRWASPVFQISDQFSKLSFEEQQAKLRKWIRRELSAPRMTRGERMISGFMTFWASVGAIAFSQTGKTVAANSFDWLGLAFVAGILTTAVVGIDQLDFISPLFTGTSKALIGVQSGEIASLDENFLLRKKTVRNRVFERIKDRLSDTSTFQNSKWVISIKGAME